MHKFIAIILAGVLVGAFSASNVQAQVGIDVGGGVSGSVGGSAGGADAGTSADAGVSAGANGDASVSDDASGSHSSISVSLSQDDAASISLDAESAERSSASVSTSNDLSAFATAKMKRDTNIEHVDASGDHVSLEYRQKARFLSFIPGSIRATAEVHADGTVDIDYPWYRFLFAVEGSDNAETELRAQVQQVMTSANGTLTARVEAELLDAMHAALSGSAVASAGSATTADMAGPNDVEALSDIEASGETSGEASGEVYPQ